MSGESVRCGICGFTHVSFTDGEHTEALEKMIAKYRSTRLGGITIELVSHRYTIENGRFSDYASERIPLANASELKMDEIVWLDQTFFGSESDKTIVVEICVGKEKKLYYNFSFDIHAAENLQVGVKMTAGLKARIAVGNAEKYVLSDEFDLCEKAA